MWQYQSHLRTFDRSLSWPSLQPYITFTSHILSSVFVLLSNLIIPWKFISHYPCFYPYPWVSQLLWGKLLPMVTGILKNIPLFPILQKNSTQPGCLLFSALMKPEFLEGMMSFCQLSASSDMSLQQLSRIRCCWSSSSGDTAGERQDHPETKGKPPQQLVMAVLSSVQCLKCPDFHSDDSFLPYFTKGKFLYPLRIILGASRRTFKETQSVISSYEI